MEDAMCINHFYHNSRTNPSAVIGYSEISEITNKVNKILSVVEIHSIHIQSIVYLLNANKAIKEYNEEINLINKEIKVLDTCIDSIIDFLKDKNSSTSFKSIQKLIEFLEAAQKTSESIMANIRKLGVFRIWLERLTNLWMQGKLEYFDQHQLKLKAFEFGQEDQAEGECEGEVNKSQLTDYENEDYIHSIELMKIIYGSPVCKYPFRRLFANSCIRSRDIQSEANCPSRSTLRRALQVLYEKQTVRSECKIKQMDMVKMYQAITGKGGGIENDDYETD